MAKAKGKKIHDTRITVTDKAPEDCEVEDIPHRKKRALLAALLETGGNLTQACKAANVSKRSHFDWKSCDPVYVAVYEKQRMRSIDILEAEAVRRAVEGTEEDVYHQGKVVGTRKKYSDNLMMFLMKERNPRYKDNWNPDTQGFSVGNVKIEFNIPRPEPPKLEEKAIDAEYTEKD